MKRFCFVLLLPLLLANACEYAKPNPAWMTNDVDRGRLARLTADPWLKPEHSYPGGTGRGMIPGGNMPLFFRSRAKRWSDDLLPGDAYGALAAEIAAARQAGWFVTGAYCASSLGNHGDDPYLPAPLRETDVRDSVDRIVVGFAKPADDLDHAEAAYLLEELWEQPDEHSVSYSVDGRTLVVGVAPHHADKGWPKYVPVQLADTCLADLRHPRLLAKADATPKANPPPPDASGYGKPLDQSGKPFTTWEALGRFDQSTFQNPDSSVPTAPST